MAKYYNPTTRQIIDVANPEMNPQLIAGTTLIPDQSITQAEREVTLPSGKTGLQDPLGNIYQYGTNPVTGLSEKQTITGDLLNPITGQTYVNPAQNPASPIVLPEKPAPLGTEQQKESDLSKQIQRLQEEIGGVGEFVGREELEIQKRGEFGIAQKVSTQQSLYNQLLNLKAQTENIPAQLQAESVGRMRTYGGIEPIQTGRLRQAGIQANILNAQYNAATGDLAMAERQVKQAVDDVFAPKEAELAAKKANLQTFKESPEYQGEKKARADAADAKIKADEAKVAAAKKVYEDIVKLSTQVTGSSVQDGQNSLIANQIMDLVNTDEKRLGANVDIFKKAQALAAKYLVKKEEKLPADIETFKSFFPDVDITTPEGRQQFLDWKAQVGVAEKKPEREPKPTTLAPEDRRTLIGSNLSDAMILNIEEGVRTIGIDKVLEDDYTEEQKRAISKIYGKEVKEVTQTQILQAAQAMKQADVENFFTARYTEDELNKFAKEAGFSGFFKKRATERADYFASPSARTKLAELLAEQYKEQGFTVK